jgi:hypothetical protein
MKIGIIKNLGLVICLFIWHSTSLKAEINSYDEFIKAVLQLIKQLPKSKPTPIAKKEPTIATNEKLATPITKKPPYLKISNQGKNSLFEISRTLYYHEMQQINKLPDNFGINENNVRIIDLESVLNYLEKYLGKNRIQYYKNIAEDSHKLLDELGKFFEEYPIRIVTDNWEEETSIKSCDTKEVHDKNKKKCIDHLMTNIKNSIDNKSIRHHLVTFIAVNEFRKLDPSHSLSFSFADNMQPMVRRNNTITSTFDRDMNLLVKELSSTSDIELNFPKNINSNRFESLIFIEEFSNTSIQNYSLGLGISKKPFNPMFHEFGHFWYIFLKSKVINSYTSHYCCFENFSSSKFLKKMFPLCENHIFSASDIAEIISKNYHNNLQAFRKYIDVLLNSSSADINVSSDDIISPEDLDKAFKASAYERNSVIADIFNSIIHCYIWGNNIEIAQVLGFVKIDGILFINRMSDFDYSVSNEDPFSITYKAGFDSELGRIHGMNSDLAYKKFNEAYQKESNHHKKLILQAILRIKELRNKGIETIIPSENTLKAMFILHGKNFDDYAMQIKSKRNKPEPGPQIHKNSLIMHRIH